jgi:hypothetical protein
MNTGSRVAAARLRLAALAWAVAAVPLLLLWPPAAAAAVLAAAANLAVAQLGGPAARILLAIQERPFFAAGLDRAALAVLYWGLLVPAGLVLRTLGRDPLGRAVHRPGSFWRSP